jgi:hypothetical protein
MKRRNIPNLIYPLIGLVGLLNYIPIFYCPELLNNFYADYKLEILSLSFSLLIVTVFVAANRKLGWIVLVVYSAVLLFSKQIRELDNQFVIYFNEGKNVSEFSTPILGYKLEVPNQKMNEISGKRLFKYNVAFGTYHALVFQKNHQLSKNSFEGDYSLAKIYNNDWWLYRKGD